MKPRYVFWLLMLIFILIYLGYKYEVAKCVLKIAGVVVIVIIIAFYLLLNIATMYPNRQGLYRSIWKYPDLFFTEDADGNQVDPRNIKYKYLFFTYWLAKFNNLIDNLFL